MNLDECLQQIALIRERTDDPRELRALEQLVRFAARAKKTSSVSVDSMAYLISVRDDLDRLRERLSRAISSAITGSGDGQ